MRTFIQTATLAAALLLSACATREGFEQRAGAMIGWSEDAVIGVMGPPLNVYETKNSGTRYLTWAAAQTGVVPGYGSASCYRGRCFSSYTPATAYALWCKLTYTFIDGKATSYQYDGNACLATKPK